MSIKFIHAADLHLDRPFRGLSQLPDSLFQRLIKAPFHALHNIVTQAIEKRVDFVVISGDLYDGSHPSLRAERRFLKEVERLAVYNIPIYLIHGNHDPLDSKRLNDTHDHLHTFSEQVEVKLFEKKGKPSVHLYGFSYPNRHVKEPMASRYKKVEGADFHIGLLHGYFNGADGHDVYAPFTLPELTEKNFDYWALGHIHQRQRLSPEEPIYYSGTPQGLSIKEFGDKGVNLVTLTDKGHEVTFLSTADFLFDTIRLDLSGLTELAELIHKIEDKKREWREKGKPGLIRLRLEGQSPLHKELQNPIIKKDLLEAFQDGEEQEPHFCWIMELLCETTPFYPREEWAKEPHFLGELIRQADAAVSLDPFVEELFRHSKGKRYLEPLDSNEETDILHEAEGWLIRELTD